MFTWINFAIFLIVAYINLGMLFMLITPKRSVIFATTVSFVIFVPFAYIKFFAEAGSSVDLTMQIVNNVIMIVLAKLLSKDSILRCLSAWLMVLCVFIGSGAIIAIFGGSGYDINSFGLTIIYLCNIPYIFIVYFVVYKLYKKRSVFESGKSGVLLVASMCIYANLEINVVGRSILNNGYELKLMNIIAYIIIGIMPFVAIVLNEIIVRNKLYKHQKEMIDLELANEKQYYENIVRQNESLAKIRHDIAGQIFVVKSIVDEDPQRAYSMLKDLEKKIEKEVEICN